MNSRIYAYAKHLYFLTVIPVIKEKPKVIKIVKKKTVIVECKVLSKFAPSCTWFKEASAVKEDSRHTVLIEPVREVRQDLYYYIKCLHSLRSR